MPALIMRAKYKDYGTFRAAFDGNKANRAAAGLSNERVFRSADDKNEIVIIMDAKETKMAKDFAASSGLKERMKQAGLLDTPTFHFLEST